MVAPVLLTISKVWLVAMHEHAESHASVPHCAQPLPRFLAVLLTNISAAF